MCPQHSLVLVVEDDHAIRESLTELLEDEGYQVAKATNGQEALEVLARVGPPCVILLDLMMPVMDGYEFMGRKTADPVLASIPVVVITAAGPARIPGTSQQEGAMVLPKPVRADAVMRAVRQYC
jgi:CheY-like chemotaxis protein